MNFFIENTQIKFWFWIFILTLFALALSGFHSVYKLGAFAIVLSLVYFSRDLFVALFYLLIVAPFFSALSISHFSYLIIVYSFVLIGFDFFLTDINLSTKQQSVLLLGCLYFFDLIISKLELIRDLSFFSNLWSDFFSFILTLFVGGLLLPFLLSRKWIAYHSTPAIEQLDLFTPWKKKPRSKQRPFQL